MTAEEQFRAAFERLKQNRPERMDAGTPVTQNNVAREAGKDPSALKKDRFPALIAEIQSFVATAQSTPAPSARQSLKKKRTKNRALRDRVKDVERERDHAMSLLVSADMKVLELYQRVADLERQLPPPTVRMLGGAR